jgi:uncharacterized protein
MPEKIIYTNTQLRGDLQEILRQMTLEGFAPDIIVGIARGGLVPATMLSHYLGKPLEVINYSLRDRKVSQASEMNDVALKIKEKKKVLLVDDICDGGDTLRNVVDTLDEILCNLDDVEEYDFSNDLKTAVLWNNIGQDLFDPNYVGREINRSENDSWVVFPYEEWWKA